MSKKQDLDRADRLVKDLEVRLKNINNSLSVLDREIQNLTGLEIQFGENLEFLKRTNVIAMADEYRKVRESLARTRIRLNSIRSDRDQADRVEKDTVAALEKARTAYNKLESESENNVVKGKFGAKNER